MFYLIANPISLSFLNTAQTKSITISTNGTLTLSEDLDWISTNIITTNFTATSNSDGVRNTDVINVFESGITAASEARAYVAANFSGLTDWYLPSVIEMVDLLNNTGLFAGFPLTHFEYWTSTENAASGGTDAVSITTNVDSQPTAKSTQLGVRPIRQMSYGTTSSPYSLGDDLGYGIVFNIDTVNKIIYIVSKEDLPGTYVWGYTTQLANANFATEIEVTTTVNDRYIIESGIITLGLEEDSSIDVQIQVLQESSDEDSQAVFMSDIIDNVIVDSMNERSYSYGIERFEALLHAKRLMQEIHYNGLQDVRVYEGPITEANKFIPPKDYVDYIRLSLVNFEGRLLPIFYNGKLNISFQYIEDQDGNIIIDDKGYPIKAQGTRRSSKGGLPSTSYRFYDGYQGYGDSYFHRSLPGYTGGQESYTGSYRYDPDAKEFLLDNLPDNFNTVVLEYISDPILAEADPTRLRIHKFFQDTIESGIYYRFISKLRDVPAYEKERARREYYNNLRIAKRRLNAKPNEIIQKLGSDIGFNKAL